MQEIYSLDFSRDGRFLVSGSGDKSARIWDIEKGQCVFDLRIEDFIHNEHGPIDAGITSVACKWSRRSGVYPLIDAVSPDGKLVAAGSLDTMVRVWNVATGQQVERLKGHKDSVYRWVGPSLFAECLRRMRLAPVQLCALAHHSQRRVLPRRQVPRVRLARPDSSCVGPQRDQARGGECTPGKQGGRGEGTRHVPVDADRAQGERCGPSCGVRRVVRVCARAMGGSFVASRRTLEGWAYVRASLRRRGGRDIRRKGGTGRERRNEGGQWQRRMIRYNGSRRYPGRWLADRLTLSGLRPLRRHLARRPVGRVRLKGPLHPVLEHGDGPGPVHAPGPQELCDFDRPRKERDVPRQRVGRLYGEDMEV